MSRGPFYQHNMDKSLHAQYSVVWNYLNGAAIKVWEWISNLISHFIMNVITFPCKDWIYPC